MGYRVSKITARNWKGRYPDRDAWNKLRAPVVACKTCSKCGRRGTKTNPIQGGHKMSLAKGGRNTRLNLGPECKSCNDKKAGRRPVNIFKGKRR